jgi:hypothetical protein
MVTSMSLEAELDAVDVFAGKLKPVDAFGVFQAMSVSKEDEGRWGGDEGILVLNPIVLSLGVVLCRAGLDADKKERMIRSVFCCEFCDLPRPLTLSLPLL